ncbi:unnamed protein product [Rodentolepis nana]|uniref:START domain-containing protein n=1 Tax=Rodentolepis nana TaxID=102285 RepID=A0A0R3T214_RODNA|nr:unnamed protein product [Rodentolepis nana]
MYTFNTPCKWPPRKVEDIEHDGGYSMALCIHLDDDAVTDEKPKRYLLCDLFNVPASNETVSFEELGRLPRDMYRSAIYPSIYDTFPQDVPMKEIVRNITMGKRVSYVSICFT